MRLLVYGMQSSGATTFARVLAERHGCIAMIDIANQDPAPQVTTQTDFIAKAVVTTVHPLSEHLTRFSPDRVVLFIRNPLDNYVSLRTKDYSNLSGSIDEKFRLLEEAFEMRDQFDALIAYEDFIAREPVVEQAMAELGWPIKPDYYRFGRSYDDLLGSLWQQEPALRHTMSVVFGNVRGREVTQKWRSKPYDAGIAAKLESLCPTLQAYYARRGLASTPEDAVIDIVAPKPVC